jgi:hypothetical protein
MRGDLRNETPRGEQRENTVKRVTRGYLEGSRVNKGVERRLERRAGRADPAKNVGQVPCTTPGLSCLG